MIEDLIKINYIDESLKTTKEVLFSKIVSIAKIFRFASLPDDLKIQIEFIEECFFEKLIESFSFDNTTNIVAVTCNVNRVFIKQYECIKRGFSIESYIAVIVHECVHIFQYYYSMIPQAQYVWFYEAIACYLAGQNKKYCQDRNCSWERFTSDFYSTPNCYELAYELGKALFNRCRNDVLDIIKEPSKYENIIKKMYNENIMYRSYEE